MQIECILFKLLLVSLFILFLNFCEKTGLEIEYLEDEKKTRLGSLKKVAISASSKFKHSFKKGRRHNRVISVIEDEIDTEELQAIDAFRQALILEELLPSKHDDHHMMLR